MYNKITWVYLREGLRNNQRDSMSIVESSLVLVMWDAKRNNNILSRFVCCYTDSLYTFLLLLLLVLLWPVTLLYKHIFNRSYINQWRRRFFIHFISEAFFYMKYVMSWQNNISIENLEVIKFWRICIKH